MKAFDPSALPVRTPSVVPASVQKGPNRTVVDGVIQSVSVSNLSKFSEEEDGCELRWYLKVIRGWSEPERSFTSAGDLMHDQLDHYLSTGENVLGKLAMQGFDLLPRPGPRPELKIEWGMDRNPRLRKNGKKLNYYSALEQSKLRAGGIPLIGFLDVEDSGDDHVLPDGSLVHEPGIVECLDHKSTGDGKWAKRAEDFPKNLQMSGYGAFLAGLPEHENISGIRLSQGYYLTKPPPNSPKAFKRSIVIGVDAIIASWHMASGPLIDRMKSVASERDERKVKPNLSACGNFGGCPHRSHCWAFKSTTPVQRLRMQLSKQSTPQPQKENMSNLLNKVKGITTPSNGAPPSQIFAAPPLPPGAPPRQLTAKDALNGHGYKFSTNAIGMFLQANQKPDGSVTYSFVQIIDGKTGGTPFEVGPQEVVELVSSPTPPAAAPPPPPAQAAPSIPPPNPTAGGASPWNNAAAATPIATTRRLYVPDPAAATADATATGTPPPTGEAPARTTLGGKGKKSDKAPAERRAQVEEAIKASHEMLGSFFADPTADQVIAAAALLLG